MALNIVVIHACGDVISRFGVGKLSDSLAKETPRLSAGLQGCWINRPENLNRCLLVVPGVCLFRRCSFGGERESIRLAGRLG